MPELSEIMARHQLSAEKVAKIVGVSDRTVNAWLKGEKGFPEPVRRLLLIVLGEVRPQDYL